VHNTCAKVSLSQVDRTRAMSPDSDDSLTESIFVSKTCVDGLNLVESTSTLSLFLEIFANHFLVCLSSESAGSFSDRQDNNVTAISRSQSRSVAKHRFKKEQTFKFIHDNEFD